MCGRFVLNTDLARILEDFQLVTAETHEFSPRYNAAPTQTLPVIVSDETHHHHLKWMRWGLIPSWATEASMGSRMINARAESIHEKPAFRNAFQRRRCVVPATGFYEWKVSAPTHGRSKAKVKVPLHIQVSHHPLFVMAGLFESWQVRDSVGKKTGEILETFTILTVEATPEMRPIHDRMPRILDREEMREWLDPRSEPARLRQWISTPPGHVKLQFQEVSRDVNSPRNDYPELLNDVSEPDLFSSP